MSAGLRVGAASQLRAALSLLPGRRGPVGVSARLRGSWGSDSASSLPDPRRALQAHPSVPRSPARLSYPAECSWLQALLAPQGTSGFASPGRGARDRRRARLRVRTTRRLSFPGCGSSVRRAPAHCSLALASELYTEDRVRQGGNAHSHGRAGCWPLRASAEDWGAGLCFKHHLLREASISS